MSAKAEIKKVETIKIVTPEIIVKEEITKEVATKKSKGKIVEIGTLTGLSALYFLELLPIDGKLWTFEKSPLHVEKSKQTLKKYIESNQCEIIEGDANLRALTSAKLQSDIGVFHPLDRVVGHALLLNLAAIHESDGKLRAVHPFFTG